MNCTRTELPTNSIDGLIERGLPFPSLVLEQMPLDRSIARQIRCPDAEQSNGKDVRRERAFEQRQDHLSKRLRRVRRIG